MPGFSALQGRAVQDPSGGLESPGVPTNPTIISKSGTQKNARQGPGLLLQHWVWQAGSGPSPTLQDRRVPAGDLSHFPPGQVELRRRNH